uniref:CDeT11-24 isoform n=1 Tax=Craterostigma plantagineum TaxID=4153 RepID=H2ETF1_CRAPL|nr:CDeT11-24 isoform [Craterostigma plantagineum]
MESQLHRPTEQEMMEGQTADHGEKKSMLAKVKEKAKKLKGSINKKHGSSQDDDADYDEEINTSPAVHGAPGMNPPPTQGGEYGGLSERDVNIPHPLASTEANLDKPADVQVPPPVPEATPEVSDKGLTEDLGSTAGQGAKESDVDPLTRGLKGVNYGGDDSNPLAGQEHQAISDEPKSFPGQENDLPQSHPSSEDEPKKFDAANDQPQSMPQDTITGKISSVPAVIVDKAAAAKNVVASKLGYGGNQAQQPADAGATQQKKPLTETAAEYKNMVAEKLTPVYEKVAGAGSTVTSKVWGSGGTTAGEQAQGGEGTVDGGAAAPNKGVFTKDYLSEKLKPGDEDKALSQAIMEKLQLSKKPAAGEGGAVDETKANESSPGVVGSIKGVVGSLIGGGNKINATESAAAANEQTQALGSGETAAAEAAKVEQ